LRVAGSGDRLAGGGAVLPGDRVELCSDEIGRIGLLAVLLVRTFLDAVSASDQVADADIAVDVAARSGLKDGDVVDIGSTITTNLGLMPLIVWQDPLFYSMAIVISFGLAVGTVLTLGVVLVIYSLFFRVSVPAEGCSETDWSKT
jgi:hypothetical protein